ncbi:MAG: hypothetical protein K1X28_08965 [Parachlamydiales bacterium]|nr:hypothetical protein [Parachlamydiales bacterium]
MNLVERKGFSSGNESLQEAVAYLKSDTTDHSLPAFLDQFAQGYKRRDLDKTKSYTYTTLSWDSCSGIQAVAEKVLARKDRKGSFGDTECQINGRIFSRPKDKTSLDSAPILAYQTGRVNPYTFLPLDYFTQADESQEFLDVNVFVKMGDLAVPAAEYFCPFTETTSAEMPVQIKRMDADRIKKGLDHISQIFERIVKQKSPKPEPLKEDLAEFVYKWSLIYPYQNDEDLIQFVQSTLAELHGYRILSPADLNRLCLSNPYLPNFSKKYIKQVRLITE